MNGETKRVLATSRGFSQDFRSQFLISIKKMKSKTNKIISKMFKNS
jgi:hypothetical protein